MTSLFTAIHLNKLTLKFEVAEEIKSREYEFVYLSPTTLINNNMGFSLKLLAKFKFRNNAQILLLSSTCQPATTEGILTAILIIHIKMKNSPANNITKRGSIESFGCCKWYSGRLFYNGTRLRPKLNSSMCDSHGKRCGQDGKNGLHVMIL
ncbi:hypothetical protein VP01_1476g4 [Puccinia sorghi]|uniref:Uncharacterized protein n=1 Tax=Puccinia sorghi TaxID=27349 RepID=A0A0L6VJK4_9BASI|nr:hypothetical protein VP01_1476g4 [Puccinia sorghi]